MMKNAVKCVMVLLFMALLIPNAKAQVKLSTTLIQGPSAPTLFKGAVDSFRIKIKNVDTVSYVGAYKFGYTSNGFPGQSYTTYQVDSGPGLYHLLQGLDTINPNDSTIALIVMKVDSGAFFSGPSVVVIWPINVAGSPIETKDSAIVQFTVNLGSTDINDPGNEESVYYHQGSIRIKNHSPNSLKRVRIYDTGGEIVFSADNLSGNSQQLPDLPAAFYIADVLFSDNRRGAISFYKH